MEQKVFEKNADFQDQKEQDELSARALYSKGQRLIEQGKAAAGQAAIEKSYLIADQDLKIVDKLYKESAAARAINTKQRQREERAELQKKGIDPDAPVVIMSHASEEAAQARAEYLSILETEKYYTKKNGGNGSKKIGGNGNNGNGNNSGGLDNIFDLSNKKFMREMQKIKSIKWFEKMTADEDYQAIIKDQRNFLIETKIKKLRHFLGCDVDDSG